MPVTTGPLSNPSRPALPTAFTHTTPAPELIYQGAEALLYRTHFPLAPSSTTTTTPPPPTTPTTTTTTTTPHPPTPPLQPAALKHRPPKPYRHPLLDQKLTRHRILSEARALVRLRREGLGKQIPAVYALDWENGWMLFEWVEGETVRVILDREMGGGIGGVVGEEGVMSGHVSGDGEGDGGEDRKAKEEGLKGLMREIGRLVALVHERGVVHGDLTTSNLMVRGRRTPTTTSPNTTPSPQQQQQHQGTLILIDFGLAAQTTQDEDRAVDLYVLERAFGSTHPRTEALWEVVLEAYSEGYKGARGVVRRLGEVRMRGRKKIMIG